MCSADKEKKTLRWFIDNEFITGPFMLVSAWSGKKLWRSWGHTFAKCRPPEAFLDLEVHGIKPMLRTREDEAAYPYLFIWVNSYDYEHREK